MVQEKFSFSEALKARSGQREAQRPVPPAPEPAPAGRFEYSFEEQRVQPPQRQAADSWSDYIDYKGPRTRRGMPEERSFPQLCESVMEVFFRDWEERDSSRSALEIQKRAIIGYEKEKSFF
ncbi:MAG: hypothetical protein J6X24_00820, partial [Firmicutes bacterium]|nr:hypothetical protein [Bacillota bacterium]